jgi:hypothetical protein
MEKLLQDRDLVELTLDPEIRHQLKERTEALRLLLSSVEVSKMKPQMPIRR